MTHGKIHLITPTESFGEKGFRKRMLIIDRETQYDRYLALEVVKDNCDKFDTVAVGTRIAFEFNVSSREYQGKWYTQARLTSFQIEAQEPQIEEDQPF